MTTLTQHAQDYLQIRHALGHKLAYATRYLPSFISYLEAQDLPTVTIAAAEAWARATPRQPASPRAQYDRLAVTRGFARFMIGGDPQTEVPPVGLFMYRQERRSPFLYSLDDIRALMSTTRHLSNHSFRGDTVATVIGLLGVTGMRVGEALRLTLADIDWEAGILVIHDTKFAKSREVVLESSTLSALEAYVTARQQWLARSATMTLFVTEEGGPLKYAAMARAFQRAIRALALGHDEGIRPHLHHLRHAFAVRTLTGWYRSGVDVEAWLPRLSTYLGHTDPRDTYWYLTAVPELLHAAARRVRIWQEEGTP